MNTDCAAQQYIPTFIERVGWKLFPRSEAACVTLPDLPSKPIKDGLVCDVHVELSFIDRLRALWSGRIVVYARTSCENVIGENKTNTGVWVKPPKYLERHQ